MAVAPAVFVTQMIDIMNDYGDFFSACNGAKNCLIGKELKELQT